MQYYKDAFSFYKRNFGVILILGLTTTLPLLVFEQFLSSCLYAYNFLVGLTPINVFPKFILSTSIIFTTQIPFIYLVSRSISKEKPLLSEIYSTFFENLFPVYMIGIVTSFLITIGAALFIIPGLILLVLFTTFPYVAVIEEKRWFSGLKEAVILGKQHFFPLLGVTVVLNLLVLIINWIILFLAITFLNNFLLVIIVQILFNMFAIPYLTAVMTYYYHDWAGIAEEW